MNKKLKISNNNFSLPPSQWIVNNLSQTNTSINLLDLACGAGRHSIYAAKIGHRVVSVDIDKNKLTKLRDNKLINPIQMDIEKSNTWPFKKNIFETIIVTNYLYRPIFKYILESINIGGKLLYETFTEENSVFGRPNNKNYLLKPQELLDYALKNNFKIISYEEIIISKSKQKKAVQRISAKKI